MEKCMNFDEHVREDEQLGVFWESAFYAEENFMTSPRFASTTKFRCHLIRALVGDNVLAYLTPFHLNCGGRVDLI
jgi:hypothetical protein